jgi:hypothetical protein
MMMFGGLLDAGGSLQIHLGSALVLAVHDVAM